MIMDWKKAQETARAVFKRHFGYQAAFAAHAPTRLELLGNHGEFHQGIVLSLAINQYVALAVAPRTDGRVVLVREGDPKPHEFWISELAAHPAAPWADVCKGVLQELRRNGVYFGGFNAGIGGLELVARFGREAATTAVAAALAVRKLYPFRVTEFGALSRPPIRDRRGELAPLTRPEKLALAKLCQRAITRFLHRSCSFMEPAALLFSKAFHATLVDCRLESVAILPLIGEVVLVLCPVADPVPATDLRLAQMYRDCHQAARKLGTSSLRSVEIRSLSQKRANLTEAEYRRAYHVIGDLQRAIFAEAALREGDFIQLGQYLYQSHASSREHGGNSSAGLDLLVSLAQEHPACLGARLTGPGFGGGTVNLVNRNHYEDFIVTLQARYLASTGRPLNPLVGVVVDGAR
jgi:galactokinase